MENPATRHEVPVTVTQPAAPATRPGQRQDIQGLRALAVLSVMLFHAGLPVPGGFVGVDIFFVISGFVITLMLLREFRRTGRIRLGQFYLRRFKRLTPALGLTVAVSGLLGLGFLSPFGQQEVGLATGVGALFLVGNAVIHASTMDYFGPDAEFNPLLHTWSLSVEEQFYLLFPAVLALSFAMSRRWRGRWVKWTPLGAAFVLGALSLAAIRGVPGVPVGSFLVGYYSPINRAWEFLVGVVLALIADRVAFRGRVIPALLGVAGLALVGVSLFAITSETPFPGKWTLVPVLGTALLIAAGTSSTSLITSALSRPLLVRIGDWSYSLYLWHWPLVVVAKVIWPFAWWAAPVATTLTFVPAYFSYRYVETPLRSMELTSGRAIAKRVGQFVGVPLMVLGLCFGGMTLTQSALADDSERARTMSTDQTAHGATAACVWEDLRLQVSWNGSCRQKDPGSAPALVILGDSHAEHLFPGAVDAFPAANIGLVAFRSPHLFNGPDGAQKVGDVIGGDQGVKVVIISRMLDRSEAGILPDERVELPALADQLARAGKQVFVLDDVPSWPSDMFTCAYRHALVLPGTVCTADRAFFATRHALVSAQLNDMLAPIAGVRRLESFWTFCDKSICKRADDQQLLYSDEDHLSAVGSRLLWRSMLAASYEFRTATAGLR